MNNMIKLPDGSWIRKDLIQTLHVEDSNSKQYGTNKSNILVIGTTMQLGQTAIICKSVEDAVTLLEQLVKEL